MNPADEAQLRVLRTLTGAQLLVLRSLAASRHGTRPAHVYRMPTLRALERRGLVRLHPMGPDGNLYVSLTDEGRPLGER